MLGNFLEISISTRSLALEHQFYRSLGFQELPVGDILGIPYAALWDGSVSIGLHETEFESPMLTFVRPDLKDRIRALRRFGIECNDVQLSDDAFNRASFLDPSGQCVGLIEARTFSPATRPPSSVSACGLFLELSMPTHSAAESAAFWGQLGFETVAKSEELYPWVRLAGHGIVIGFHQLPFRAGLSFVATDYSARKEYLSAGGQKFGPRAPLAIGSGRSASISSASGIPVYLFETDS